MSVPMDIGSGLVGVQPCLELSRPKCSVACAEPAVICRLEAELRRPVKRWSATLLMCLQQALLYPHPMESNLAWAQTGVTMLSRINLHRVRAQYQPAVRLERPLLVFRFSREAPNARRFQGQTCSVSCEDFKNIYIWYPDQDQSIEIWRSTKSRVFSHRDFSVIT
jgi:hypothetical protein